MGLCYRVFDWSGSGPHNTWQVVQCVCSRESKGACLRGMVAGEHVSECEQNYEESSPVMEMEGWKILFGRSVEKHKMKYMRVVSDGD